MKTGGLEVLLKNDIPIINIRDDLLHTSKAVKKLSDTLDRLKNKRMIALCFSGALDQCLNNLKNRNLNEVKIQNIVLPFFGFPEINLYVIEVSFTSWNKNNEVESLQKTSDQTEITNAEISRTLIDKPLPEYGYEANIFVKKQPASLRVNSVSSIEVSIKNISKSLWPAKGQPGGPYTISLAYHWLDKDGCCPFL